MSKIIDCKTASKILEIDRGILNKIIKKRGGVGPYKIRIPLEAQVGNRCFFMQDQIENCAKKLKEKRMKWSARYNSAAVRIDDKKIFKILNIINTIKEKENRDPSIRELVPIVEAKTSGTIMQLIRSAVLKGYLHVEKRLKNGKKRNVYTILKMPPIAKDCTLEYAEIEVLVNSRKLQKMEDRYKDLIKEVQYLLQEMEERRQKVLHKGASFCHSLRDLKNDLPQI